MRKVLKVFVFIFLVFVVLIGAFTVYLFVSPRPSVFLVRYLFGLTEYTPHEQLDEMKPRVKMYNDLTYTSTKGMNEYDILVRTDLLDEENVPTILWIHGGAFVAGDKDDVTDYMYVLADNGYAIVNMNYGLGFEYTFPTPLVQIGEMYKELEKNEDLYPFLDLDNLIIGGDSAGAFLAAQFIINNTNMDYSKLTGVEPVMDKSQIKGALLFCGPYDFGLLKNLLGHHVETPTRSSESGLLGSIVGFFAQNIGHAFLGEKNWSENDKWEMLSLRNYVTSDFPVTFLTDAKNISFEQHAKGLAYELKQLNVEVTEVYYEAELSHEYQFNLSTINEDGNNYGMMTLEKVLLFLDNLNHGG